MSSSSWRALGRSTILAIGPTLSCHQLETPLHPHLGLLPGFRSHRDGLAASLGFLQLRFHRQTDLSLLLLPDELAHILAGGAKTTPVNLLIHPLLKGSRERNVHACSHA